MIDDDTGYNFVPNSAAKNQATYDGHVAAAWKGTEEFAIYRFFVIIVQRIIFYGSPEFYSSRLRSRSFSF